jgi:uncharacterized protein with PQ loop repeat
MLRLLVFLAQFIDFRNFVVASSVVVAIAVSITINFFLFPTFSILVNSIYIFKEKGKSTILYYDLQKSPIVTIRVTTIIEIRRL